MSDVLRHDPADRRARRYSTTIVTRARELAAAGWTAEQVVGAIARDHGIDAMPSVNTVKAWIDPEWGARRRQTSAAADRRWRARKKKEQAA